MLPTRATLEDVQAVCKYLIGKPTGATTAEAKKVIDSRHLDGRKIAALKAWGFIQIAEDGRMKVTDIGRRALKVPPERNSAFAAALRDVDAYRTLLEKLLHGEDDAVDTNQVAAYWHENFNAEASDNDDVLKDQAICFFQLAEGAGLGKVVLGRKGAVTRIELDKAALEHFGDGASANSKPALPAAEDDDDEGSDPDTGAKQTTPPAAAPAEPGETPRNNRVFLTHGKNSDKIIAQLKEIVTFGKLAPIVAEEHETVSKPVPDKVMDDMRSCFAGVIHVAGEQVLMDNEGKQHHKINENVLIEIGAAMALYGRNFILLVQRGVQLPSNLQGLYECRYEGDKLDGEATMKLLKAFNEFA